MPRPLKKLIRELEGAGFVRIKGGKGSHRKYVHDKFQGAVTLSGKTGADALHYQEKQVAKAIEAVKHENH